MARQHTGAVPRPDAHQAFGGKRLDRFAHDAEAGLEVRFGRQRSSGGNPFLRDLAASVASTLRIGPGLTRLSAAFLANLSLPCRASNRPFFGRRAGALYQSSGVNIG